MSKYPLVEMTAQPFAFVKRRTSMDEIPKAMEEGFTALMTALGTGGITPAGMPFCHYISWDEKSANFELGFPIAKKDVGAAREAGLEIGTTVGGRVMKALHIGPYDTLGQTYEKMMGEIEAEGLEGASDMWEAYFSPPETPPAKIRTEVYWPVKQAA